MVSPVFHIFINPITGCVSFTFIMLLSCEIIMPVKRFFDVWTNCISLFIGMLRIYYFGNISKTDDEKRYNNNMVVSCNSVFSVKPVLPIAESNVKDWLNLTYFFDFSFYVYVYCCVPYCEIHFCSSFVDCITKFICNL